jgi:hypothetical protein
LVLLPISGVVAFGDIGNSERNDSVGVFLGQHHAHRQNSNLCRNKRLNYRYSHEYGDPLKTPSGIVIESLASSVLNVSASEQGFIASFVPAEVSLAFGISHSTNKLTINSNAQLIAAKDITIDAITARNHKVSSSGGAGNSYIGLSLGVLYSKNETDLLVDGVLTAEGNISLKTTTTTANNSVNAIVKMANPGLSGWNTLLSSDPDILGFVGGNVSFIFNKFYPITTANDKIGIAGAISVLKDSVTTNAVIQATVTAGNDITVSAAMANKIYTGTSTTVSVYNNSDASTKKQDSIALSLPIIIVENDTSAVVSGDAVLKADGKIDITSSTTIPYNLTHPLYTAIADESNSANITKIINTLLSPNLGIDQGFLNTWTQSISKTEDWSVGVMLTLLFVDNVTKAVVDDGVTISGKTVATKPDLNVSANTKVELGNLVGNFSSFCKGLAAPALKAFTDGLSSLSGNDFFANLYGQEIGGTAIGGAFLGSFIDNTTIARINHATINAGDVKVTANMESLDIGFHLVPKKVREEWVLTPCWVLPNTILIRLPKLTAQQKPTSEAVPQTT